MKFSEQWLREWTNPSVATQDMADQLTMAGLEVDAIEPVAAAFSGVVVGKVVSIDPHPQADRLQVCQVDVGKKATLTIVCGARNVAVYMLVPTACIGAVLPGGMKIKKTKLRGVESQGMLCSAAELGLAESADGLMPLDSDARPGTDIREYLLLKDVSIELGLTPNRSDCLSVAGVAREVAVLNRVEITGPEIGPVSVSDNYTFPVQVQSASACPRYLGRVIKNINPKASTPLWMQERLRRSGLRAISPVVDVTNYVMLELGQPMHAFDLDRLSDAIVVRQAVAGEQLVLLNEQTVELNEQTLVIADETGPLAIAGVMGGRVSAVAEDTRSLFLESAFFAPKAITGKARMYGLHTDSSHRFERGVDPQLAQQAMERATELLLAIVGGQAGPVVSVEDSAQLPVFPEVSLRLIRLNRVLGMSIPHQEVSIILRSLGMTILHEDENGWRVQPPSYRFDIAIEADLIEEVARVHGYHRLPVSQAKSRLSINTENGTNKTLEESMSSCLVQRDYQEAICYSFVAEDLQLKLDPDREAIKLANPLSADLTVMRTSLWPGLVQALQHNLNRQHRRVRLFETGVRYLRQADEIVEDKMIAGIVTGDVVAEQWGQASRRLDFYDVKSDVEALLSCCGGEGWRFVPSQHPALHPGQTAVITDKDDTVLGFCGLLHPSVLTELSLDSDVYVFELNIDALSAPAVTVFNPLSRYPAIRRDLAIVLADSIGYNQVRETIAEAAGELMRETIIFDVYTGNGVESGAKSLAIGLTLQDFSRTLTDDEVEAVVDRVLNHLNEKLSATLRG